MSSIQRSASWGLRGAGRFYRAVIRPAFGYHKKPSKLIAFVLLCCFLVPGIVYLVLAGKKESLSVSTTSHTGGDTVVQVVSNGSRGKGAGRRMRAQLKRATSRAAASGDRSAALETEVPSSTADNEPVQVGTPADWYPDPDDKSKLRYWDGSRWTQHYHAEAAPSEEVAEQ